MSKSTQNVYTFENVYVEINGRRCPVSSAQLALVETAIPKLSLTIDPIHTLSSSTSSATTPQLSALTYWNDQYCELALKRTKCQFNATILKLGQLEQSIHLKDWILTGAGLTSVSAAGSLALQLELQHPMCLCQDSILSMPYIKSLSPFSPSSMSAYQDIVSVLYNVVTVLSQRLSGVDLKNVAPSACASAGGAVDAQRAKNFLAARMKDGAKIFNDNLEWDKEFAKIGYNTWPFSKCLSPYLNQVKYTLVEYLRSGVANNLWELLAGPITNEWMLCVMPVLNGKLKLRPSSPWLPRAMLVYDEDITTLNFPGIDPTPLIGVSVADVNMTNGVSFYQYKQRNFSTAGLTYAPAVILNDPSQYRGVFIQAKIPGWLLAAQNRQSGFDCSVNNAWFRNTQNTQITGSTIEQGQLATMVDSSSTQARPSAAWTGASFGFAKAMFYQLFRQNVQVGIKTRLMIQSNFGVSVGGSKLILPCNVCGVVSTPQRVAFDFYVTSVIHSFDCERGQASTQIAGTHARPSKGFPGILLPNSGNPLYVA